jgi:hypothetical protein
MDSKNLTTTINKILTKFLLLFLWIKEGYQIQSFMYILIVHN